MAKLITLEVLAGHARASAATETIWARMLDWAERHALGHWYGLGGTGPAVYDCSGLVYRSAHELGVNMPRTTYQMLSSPLLYRVSRPQRGDLAFFGTEHVEFVAVLPHTTFGAHGRGTRVGWRSWNAGWHPTMYFRIR